MIFLIIENWTRDFETRAMIAHRLATHHNKNVVLLPKNLANLLMPLIPGVYLHKSLQSHISRDIRSLLKLGGRYLVLDEEVIIRDISLSNRYGLSPDLCSAVFCNNATEFQDLTSRGFKNLFLFGNPRLLPSEIRYRHSRSAKKVSSALFSSNFSMIRPAGATSVDRVVSDMALDDVQAKKLSLFIDLHRVREVKIRNGLIQLAREIQVTYRVHPLESFDLAKLAFEGTNVNVVKGGSIGEDIMSHDVVLHAGCSVALDSILLNKKSIWIYPSLEEIRTDKARLSYISKEFPSLRELQEFRGSQENQSLESEHRQFMSGVVCESREDSVVKIAYEIDKMSQVVFFSIRSLMNFFKVPFLIALWLYRFHNDPIEKERYDSRIVQQYLDRICGYKVRLLKLPGKVILFTCK